MTSRPTTRKKIAIRPSLTQWRRSSSSSQRPRCTPSSVVHRRLVARLPGRVRPHQGDDRGDDEQEAAGGLGREELSQRPASARAWRRDGRRRGIDPVGGRCRPDFPARRGGATAGRPPDVRRQRQGAGPDGPARTPRVGRRPRSRSPRSPPRRRRRAGRRRPGLRAAAAPSRSRWPTIRAAGSDVDLERLRTGRVERQHLGHRLDGRRLGAEPEPADERLEREALHEHRHEHDEEHHVEDELAVRVARRDAGRSPARSAPRRAGPPSSPAPAPGGRTRTRRSTPGPPRAGPPAPARRRRRARRAPARRAGWGTPASRGGGTGRSGRSTPGPAGSPAPLGAARGPGRRRPSRRRRRRGTRRTPPPRPPRRPARPAQRQDRVQRRARQAHARQDEPTRPADRAPMISPPTRFRRPKITQSAPSGWPSHAASRPTVSITAIGSLAPDSTSSRLPDPPRDADAPQGREHGGGVGGRRPPRRRAARWWCRHRGAAPPPARPRPR